MFKDIKIKAFLLLFALVIPAVFFGSLAINDFIYAWTEPTQPPPQGVGSGGASYWTASGNNIYSSNTGNVGIGSQSPQDRLHVLDGNIRIQGGGPGIIFNDTLALVDNRQWKLYVNIGTGEFMGIATNDVDTFAQAWLRVQRSGPNIARVLFENGNVGIGTDNPAQRLDVNGQVRIRGGAPAMGRVLTSSVDGTASWQALPAASVSWPLLSTIDGTIGAPAYSWSTDSNMGIRRGGTDDLRFVTAGADRVTIDSAGNVGIGTAGPEGKLHVSGNVFLGHGNKLFIGGANAADGEYYKIVSTAWDVGMDYHHWTAHRFFASDLVTPKMVINNQGNVGIGESTALPARLNVNGAIASVGVGFAGPISGLAHPAFYRTTSGGTNAPPFNAAGGLAIQSRDLASAGIGFLTGSPLTTKMVILGNGNVGIGTADPGAKLHIYGETSARVIIQSPDTNWADIWYLSGPSGDAVIGITGSSRASGAMFVRTNSNHPVRIGANSRDVMSITPAGYVGIGTADPGAKLHIGGIAGTDGIMFPDGTIQTTAAFAVKYDSGWFAVANNSYYTRAHGIGVIPGFVNVLAADSATPATVYQPNTEESDSAWNRGYSVSFDAANVRLYCSPGGYRRQGGVANWAWARIIVY